MSEIFDPQGERTVDWYKHFHRDMWCWLAKHPNKDKLDWPMWSCSGGEIPIGSVLCMCFVCGYAKSLYLKHPDNRYYTHCFFCPTKLNCEMPYSLYNRWLAAGEALHIKRRKGIGHYRRLRRELAEKILWAWA